MSSIPRFQILKRDDFRCVYCGKRATDIELHIDHVIPRSKKGTNDTWNLATSCIPCNLSKSDRVPSEEKIREIRERDALWKYPDRAGDWFACWWCGKPTVWDEDDDDRTAYCETCHRVAAVAYEAGSGFPL